MTENEAVLGLRDTGIVASYSQTQAAELAYELLMKAATNPLGNEIRLTDFKIID